ncbi:hypothetical protein K450DRAFT_251548 [Umbelopsis ramanniana AG]|uniref:Secreted protein n=1 Tax=Umbelopsis ramanniana AG TaxID=1314678 RepID=A0AAD5HC75_UMBRA|nr:uncharacterized protein K450DRAFT_251548 [Umbelopsis ramanniana AG]KAI8577589.1 hypothetical protein K450DRAFT_251548 [Umbelopsis ramanniana AG]
MWCLQLVLVASTLKVTYAAYIHRLAHQQSMSMSDLLREVEIIQVYRLQGAKSWISGRRCERILHIEKMSIL